jgi:hypothetical protein
VALGVEVAVGVAVGLGVGVGLGVMLGVGVGVGGGPDCAQYLPPVLVAVLFILASELFHLPDGRMCLQLSFCTLF